MRLPRVVLLADDHKIVAQGLQRLLEPEFRIAGIVEDGRSLVAAAARIKPDVIVTEMSIPIMNGLEAIHALKKAAPSSWVVILTMHSNLAYVTEAFQAGAKGYVLKSATPSELAEAIRSVLAGKTYLTSALQDRLSAPLPVVPGGSKKSEAMLSPRERQVLQLLAEGRIAKEIGAALGISRKTAEFHKYRIMEKLGLHSVAALALHAARHGLVDPEV